MARKVHKTISGRKWPSGVNFQHKRFLVSARWGPNWLFTNNKAEAFKWADEWTDKHYSAIVVKAEEPMKAGAGIKSKQYKYGVYIRERSEFAFIGPRSTPPRKRPPRRR